MLVVLTYAVAALLAANMGASGLAPSFAACLGADMVSRRTAVLAYSGFVLVGSVLMGAGVAKTLGGSIAPQAAFTPGVTLATLSAVSIAMLGATLLRIPQSTSWVTVAAVVTVGVHHGQVELTTLYSKLLPAWIGLPLVSYLVSYLVMRRLYPLRADNIRVHERLKRWRPRMRWVVLGAACYVAFAIGSNNVANVVGPLAASGIIDPRLGLLVFAPLFGAGAWLLRGPAETMARDIVPVGEVSAATTGIIVGSLLLVASAFGIPQSLVQLQAAAVLAISRVKEESVQRMPGRQLARVGAVWIGAPIAAAAATRALLEVLR